MPVHVQSPGTEDQAGRQGKPALMEHRRSCWGTGVRTGPRWGRDGWGPSFD